MNIHEYQAKALLDEKEIAIPKGYVASSVEEAIDAYYKLEREITVVKAQIHAGGRGKAGGVKLLNSESEVKAFAEELLGENLVTAQTGPKGKVVEQILIEEGCAVKEEYYLSIILDRETAKYLIVSSQSGGINIENVASMNPEEISIIHIDPLIGLQDFQARAVAFSLKVPEKTVPKAVDMIKKLYQLFIEKDCLTVEINPLVLTEDDRLIALDAKFSFDDNALFRQEEILKLRDLSEENSQEVHAEQFHLNYIALEGNIGCMVNGAGLAMATMDMIKHFGGEPANFLDVGGSATKERITEAFRIILSDRNVRGIFVNIFGGIIHCDVIAQGIIEATKEINLTIPLVVRLAGTNVEKGISLLKASKLKIIAVQSMEVGAKQITTLI